MTLIPFIIGCLAIIILILALIYFAGVMIGIPFGAPFIPTNKKVLKKMIEVAKIKKGDLIFDLGCGNGQLLFAAEKLGAKCVGIEIVFQVFLIAKINKFLKKSKSEIRLGSFYNPRVQKDLENADTIFTYISDYGMNKFHKKIYPKLKKGARVISNSFTIKNLKPDKTISREETGRNTIYVYKKR